MHRSAVTRGEKRSRARRLLAYRRTTDGTFQFFASPLDRGKVTNHSPRPRVAQILTPKRTVTALATVSIIGALLLAVNGTDETGGGERTPDQGSRREDGANEPDEGANLYQVDLRTGRVRQLTRDQGEGAREPAWWPGRRIAFITLDCDGCLARLFVLQSGDIGEVRVRKAEHLFQPAWSPGGQQVAAIALGRGIHVVNGRGGSATQLTSGQSDEAPSWSPRGDLIAFTRP